MKPIAVLIRSLMAQGLLAYAAADAAQVFSTSAGPVKITPLNHASTLIEAGGKTIYLDPAKPVNFSGLPKGDLVLVTDIHGDHMDPDSIKEVSKAGTDSNRPATSFENQEVFTRRPCHHWFGVTKNFVRRPIIKRWQRIDTPQKIFYLPGQNPVVTASEPFAAVGYADALKLSSALPPLPTWPDAHQTSKIARL
jgi:Beta-lactamase superfamily domain